MKKIAKLSLVAAMAVTAANATALEEAIKNVDVSGKVYVETIADSNQATNGGTDTTTDLDFDITFKSKVNDNVTAVVKLEGDDEDSEKPDNNNVQDKKTANENVTVENIYFAYQNGPLTANFGRQDINTPNTDGEIGDGVLALYNAGFATFAGAYFYDTGLEDGIAALEGEDIAAAAVLGSVGPVNAELWYVKALGDHITAVVSGEVAGIKLGARYATSELDGVAKDGESLKLTASTQIGAIGLNATYFSTDKDGGATVTDASSANTYELSQLGVKGSAYNTADVDVWALGASYTMDAMKYQIDYADLEEGADKEADELRFRTTYTMSKNFKVMATYSMYEATTSGTVTKENNSARLEAKYSF
jgi:predicted porin